MQTLITPTVVVARAFADGEYVAPETVSEAAIVAAQETYLESHAAQFPLYDPQANVLNRCSIDGKLVQTR